MLDSGIICFPCHRFHLRKTCGFSTSRVPACLREAHLSSLCSVTRRVSSVVADLVDSGVPEGVGVSDSRAVFCPSQSWTVCGIWARFATHHLIPGGFRMGLDMGRPMVPTRSVPTCVIRVRARGMLFRSSSRKGLIAYIRGVGAKTCPILVAQTDFCRSRVVLRIAAMGRAKTTHRICRIAGCSEQRCPTGPLLLRVPSASK